MKRAKSAAINFQSQEGILVKDLKVLRCVGGKTPWLFGGFPRASPPPLSALLYYHVYNVVRNLVYMLSVLELIGFTGG